MEKESKGGEATKQCPHCKSVIPKTATKCSHCSSDVRNWFAQHKILSVFLILLVVGFIGNKINVNNNITKSLNAIEENNKKLDDAMRETDPNYQRGFTTPSNESSGAKYTKEKCNSIATGMSEGQVKGILGNPTSATESKTAGIGTSKLWQFQEAFSFKGCQVYFMNGSVSSVSWVEL